MKQSGLIRNRYIIMHIASVDEILAVTVQITDDINSNNNKVIPVTLTTHKLTSF